MSKLSHPSLSSYTCSIESLLETPGPSLYDLESTPPQNIFPLCLNSPIQITNTLNPHDIIIKQLQLDQNANIRAVYYLILHRCFTESSLKPLGQLLEVILGDSFKILFPEMGFETDPALFNDRIFKKLLVEFLRIIDSQRLTIEECINKYPIIDIILVHVIRTVANKYERYEYQDKIPTGKLVRYAHEIFGLRVLNEENNLYVFENNTSILDSFNTNRIYICYPKPGAVLEMSKVNSEHTFINIIGDIKDSRFIKQSHVFPYYDKMKHSQIVGQTNPHPFTRLMDNSYGKVVSSQIFPVKTQRPPSSSFFEPFERRQPPNTSRQENLLRESYTARSNNMFRDQKTRPVSSFSQPRSSFVGDVKDELRKSIMRVSVMKSKDSNLNNKRVSTNDIFNNDEYFGGSTTKSQILANRSQQQYRPSNVSSKVSPFQEIMKQNSVTERNTYVSNTNTQQFNRQSANFNPPAHNQSYNTYQSTYKNYDYSSPYLQNSTTYPLNTSNYNSSTYPINTSITVPSHSLTSSTFYPPQVTSSYNISADGRTNTIKVQINQPVNIHSSLQSYYGDFTSSHVLDHLPSHNRSSIQEIKKSLIIEKKLY